MCPLLFRWCLNAFRPVFCARMGRVANGSAQGLAASASHGVRSAKQRQAGDSSEGGLPAHVQEFP